MYWNKERITEQLASLPSSLQHSESAKSCRILSWVLKHLNVSAWLCFLGYLCYQDTSCTQLLICHTSLGIVGQESMDQLCCCLAVSGSFATPWTVAHQSPPHGIFLGKITGVGCYFLFPGVFLTQGLNLCLCISCTVLFTTEPLRKPSPWVRYSWTIHKDHKQWTLASWLSHKTEFFRLVWGNWSPSWPSSTN